MTEHPQRYAFSAVWFDPPHPPQAYAEGMIAVLNDLGGLVPELAVGGWSLGPHEVTDPASLTTLIKTTEVPEITQPDGSPLLSTGFMIGSPHPDRRTHHHEDHASLRFSRDADLERQQTLDLILMHSTLPVAIEAVRSMARNLQADVVGGDTREFGRALSRARTVPYRFTTLVGQLSWIRGLTPDAVTGYPVTDVEEYAGGLFFRARGDSEHDAIALAGLNDQLERDETRQRLGLLPQFHPGSHEA